MGRVNTSFTPLELRAGPETLPLRKRKWPRIEQLGVRLGDRRTIGAAMAMAAEDPCFLGLRARGVLDLGFASRAGRTRMVRAFQSGCLRARVPRHEAAERACAVLINTGGGVTGGDQLDQRFDWAQGAAATVTTQAAEKVYRSTGADVLVKTRLTVAAGAVAEWLPQETILFDQARLSRRIEIDLARDASLLAVEAVTFGRAAMGETVRQGSLADAWRIRRDGRLVYADAKKLGGRMDAALDRAAIGAGARAMAVIIFAHANAAALLPSVRDALAGRSARGAASAFDGLLIVRLLATDGAAVRGGVIAALSVLREGRPLPRVWNC